MGCAALAPTRIALAQATGAGAVTCAQYVRAARTSDIVYHQASNWVLGYLSGLSAGMQVAPGSSPLAGLSNDQVLRSVGDYCERNPGSTMAQAVAAWAPPAPPPPQQVEAKPAEQKSGSWIINLDRAPDRRPSMDRR
jgi:hypothetical protein